METRYILVALTRPDVSFTDADADSRVKTIGPFETEDAAREWVNTTARGIPNVLWVIRPLMG